MSKYKIKTKRKIEKQIKFLPENVKLIFYLLMEEIKELGPVRTNWLNYSKLDKNKHHCHLKRKYVACWEEKKKDNQITIEVYYVGSREKAPY